MKALFEEAVATLSVLDVNIPVTATVILGLVFLIGGAKGAFRVAIVLRKGRSWRILSGLVFFLVAGYSAFALVLNAHLQIPIDIISMALLLSGGVFVWLVVKNAEKTLNTVLRMKNLETMVNTDPLTGLSNRRFLDSKLDAELERCLRYERPCSVVMLDIDHFKRINDTHGHEAGDQILVELGALMKRFHRTTDVVARYGGEEFVTILVETTEMEAVAAAERLRAAIETHPFSICGKNGKWAGCTPVTASIGVAGYSNVRDSSSSDLIRRADLAMYTAKKGGRNRVIVDQSTSAYIGEKIASRIAPAFNYEDLGRISA